MNLKQTLDDILTDAMRAAGVSEGRAIVKQSQRAEFGHYQANGIMGAAKKMKTNPRELADAVVEALGEDARFTTEIAGPGFINITLSPGFINDSLAETAASDRLGVALQDKQRVIVDYSSPNLAKEMHIGHLRPTTIGDAAVRVLEFLGHEAIRANHVGDWGAQFGSLLAYMDDLKAKGENELSSELKDLEQFYIQASGLFKNDEAFAKRAREYVVRLQGGDEDCLALWREFIEESVSHCQRLYEKMNITLTEADMMPESMYNDDLNPMVEDLKTQGLLVEDDGAQCVFLEEFRGKDGNILPAMIQKSDGGFPYMATDVSAIRHRIQNLNADAALYCVGVEQQLHLKQVFAVARAAGYLGDQDWRHLPNGFIQKKGGGRFKTRTGGNVKLEEIIDEGIERARKLVEEKNPELSEAEKDNIARVVGVGAIKYAELSKNRTTDYTFDWDVMLSFEGNTAPYLQYAYTRIQSIFRRAGVDRSALPGIIAPTETAELALAVKLLQFPEAISTMTEDWQANVICGYLFELAGQFMTFYEACPILSADDTTRDNRLQLAGVTARTLALGLDLLGIETVEQM